MKSFKIGLFALTTLLFAACGGIQNNQIAGKWKLIQFSDDKENIELTACDNQTIWHFTTKEATPLSDGTQVQVLTGEAPNECQYYSFDSSWMLTDGKLFISTCRIGGMGGMSLAGLMEITELESNKMVLSSMGKELTFERQ
jgi:hypothetical protein